MYCTFYLYERKQLKKGNQSKILNDNELSMYIVRKLKEGWSPELISGRLKAFKSELEYVSHETIYSYIYSEEMVTRRLWMYLRRHRKKRYKQGVRKSRKGGTVKNMVSISKRPKEVDTRERVGDWESDSVQFSRQKGILSVQVERKTRQVLISKCSNKTALETKNAVIEKLRHHDNVKTITFNRGTEGALHEEIAKELGIKTYFCHAYCSWEKGAVENRNMFIREYLPRNIIISEVSNERIYEIQEILNNRPMKCLNYRTPNEMVFYEKYKRFPPF